MGKMKISIIVSVSENWVIGKDNKLLWKLSDDLKRFKELTTGHPIIMGQKTFESLPNGALPDRINIVLSDKLDYSAPNILVADSIIGALEIAKRNCGSDCEVFIIGGGMVYKHFLDYADCIYLTTVHTIIDGDTTFPEIKSKNWKLISEEFKEKDEKNEYNYTYRIYNRKK
jgi:dihydrofolate reductase